MREEPAHRRQPGREPAPRDPAAQAVDRAGGSAAPARLAADAEHDAAPRRPGAAPVPGLLLASGNAAVSRYVASLAREPATAAAPPATATDEADQRAIETVRAASAASLLELARALAALGPDRTRLEPRIAADVHVDTTRLALAGRVLAVKDAPSTEAYVALGKDLESAGVPLAERDAVYAFLGISGLAAPSQIGAFAADVQGAMGWLAGAKGFDARAAKLVGLVDARLTAVGVPRLLSADPGGAHELGRFIRKTWSVEISPQLGELDVAADADKATAIVTTFYHEARHAEQDFHLIRLLMAEHRDELDQIEAPDDVLAAAEAAGAPEGADRGLAGAVRDAQYGAGAGAFEQRREALRGEYAELEARGAPKAELEAKYQERWENYAGQAHEADAFQTEKRLKTQLNRSP